MTKQILKQKQRVAERRQMIDRINAAIVEAKLAAQTAYEAHKAKVERDPVRCASRPNWIAWVWVYKPSYLFRVALIEADVIHESKAGEWRMSCENWGLTQIKRLDEQEAVCNAVRLVLSRHFPGEFIGYSTGLD